MSASSDTPDGINPDNAAPAALSPEQIAGVWAKLQAAADKIDDPETRERYLADWRARYEAQFPRWLSDASIVSLPDWKHLGEISARERRQAGRVSAAWLDDQWPDRTDPDAARRLAWELGRRSAAGFIEPGAAQLALAERLGDAAGDAEVGRAFARGADGTAGEALLAAIVLDLRCAQHQLSGLGLAMRFRDRHGHDLRHTTAKGWLRWDGKRWKVLDEERGLMPAALQEMVFDTITAIQREAAAIRATGIDPGSIPDGIDASEFKVEVGGRKVVLLELEDHPEGLDALMITPSTCRLKSDRLAAFGRAREENDKVRSVPDMVRRWLTVGVQEFDTDPLTINCQNGTLRLIRDVETGEDGERAVVVSARLDPHSRSDLLTKIVAVPYDPEAACPNYDGTVEWAQPKAEMRRYIHQWGGYNLTGDMGAQIFHIWWGPLAQNGKSTILDAWADCTGDYADAGKIETFMEASRAQAGDAATPALARLPGVRMLRTGEPPANAKFEESLINQITGQDTLQIRELNRGFYAVKMHFKLTVACNLPPSIPNATEGIRRRIKVVPFEKTMKNAVKPDGTPLRDENFKAKLVPELPGIFARLVEGALDWLQHGFIEPGDVTSWTEQYKDENDPLGRFLSYCVVVDPDSRIQSSRFHELFQAWAKATSGPDWTPAYLKKKMIGKGFNSKTSNGVQWLGLRAVRQKSDFVDEHGNVIDLSGVADDPAHDPHAGGAVSARALVAGSGSAPPPGDWLPPHHDDIDPFGD